MIIATEKSQDKHGSACYKSHRNIVGRKHCKENPPNTCVEGVPKYIDEESKKNRFVYTRKHK